MPKILALNGPNLNLLGTREPEVYGSRNLADIMAELHNVFSEANCEFEWLQSNAEHELVDKIHLAAGKVDYIIINPAAFTHTSVAIRDALLGVNIPFIEVHLSNTHKREDFRHKSYLSDIAEGVIMGLGAQGYSLAAQAALSHIAQKQDH